MLELCRQEPEFVKQHGKHYKEKKKQVEKEHHDLVSAVVDVIDMSRLDEKRHFE